MTIKPVLASGAALACILLAACNPSAKTQQDAGATATASATATPSTAAVDLAAFAGKLPSAGFLEAAPVKAILAKLPADVIAFIGAPAAEAPIETADGKLIASGCEAHNCATRNWTVVATQDGTSGDVCVYDATKSPTDGKGVVTWYLADGKKTTGAGEGCPRNGDELKVATAAK